jgi:hypothetical protein
MKSQKKNKLSEIVDNVKLLKPKQKLVVLKAMQDEKPLTEKDIKIMQWSLDVMKEAKKNNELLQGGLKILNRAIERQNKKS